MTVNVYTVGKEHLIGTYNVRSAYDYNFYYRNMPKLSARRCREILNIISPNYKIESETLVFENVDTGYTGAQTLYRHGTVLNF